MKRYPNITVSRDTRPAPLEPRAGNPYASPGALATKWIAVAAVILLATVPRLIHLGQRPLMHDESLFSYYSYSYFTDGRYIHIPMLHGPTLMLVTGKLFKFFGDRIETGRTFVALVTLIGMAAGAALWPRRYRLWLAALLVTSPILLFYSRFFRDDMIIATCYLLATLGTARALSRAPSPWRPLWAVLGACFMIVPLAIMESALFFQASGVTFFLAWLASRWLWRRPSFSLRAPARPPLRRYTGLTPPPLPDKAARARRRRDIREDKSFNAVVMPEPGQPQPAILAPPPPAPVSDGQSAVLLVLGWCSGIALGLAIVMFVYGITYDFSQLPEQFGPHNGLRARLAAPLLNMKASWVYWKGQHMEHRIEGPLHYHLPILVIYELPLLLLLYAGMAWDATRRANRAKFYAAFLILWVWFWVMWRWISYLRFWDFDPVLNRHAPPPWLKPLTDFLHIQPDISMLILGLLIVPLLTWSVLMLREHRPLASWTGWWAACSLFQYSSAGEKVPWLALHIDLPMILALGWVWAPHLRRMGRRGQAVAAGLALAALLIAVRNDYYLIGPRAADPRERLVYNHTPPAFAALCNSRLAAWRAEASRIPMKQRVVLLIDQPGWPGVWYFRHCGYQILPTAPDPLPPGTDLAIGNRELMQPLADKLDRKQWHVIENYPENTSATLSLRDHWLAPWPAESMMPVPGQKPFAAWVARADVTLRGWWIYYWLREPWTDPGGFPLIAIEPVRTR